MPAGSGATLSPATFHRPAAFGESGCRAARIRALGAGAEQLLLAVQQPPEPPHERPWIELELGLAKMQLPRAGLDQHVVRVEPRPQRTPDPCGERKQPLEIGGRKPGPKISQQLRIPRRIAVARRRIPPDAVARLNHDLQDMRPDAHQPQRRVVEPALEPDPRVDQLRAVACVIRLGGGIGRKPSRVAVSCPRQDERLPASRSGPRHVHAARSQMVAGPPFVAQHPGQAMGVENHRKLAQQTVRKIVLAKIVPVLVDQIDQNHFAPVPGDRPFDAFGIVRESRADSEARQRLAERRKERQRIDLAVVPQRPGVQVRNDHLQFRLAGLKRRDQAIGQPAVDSWQKGCSHQGAVSSRHRPCHLYIEALACRAHDSKAAAASRLDWLLMPAFNRLSGLRYM